MAEMTVVEKYLHALKRMKFSMFLIYTMLIGWAMTTIFPFVWAINNSFKTTAEFVKDPFGMAASFNMVNYENAFNLIKIGKSYINSLVISGGTMILTLFVAGFAAYALSRFEFKMRGAIQMMLAAGMLVPVFGTIIPQYEFISKLGLIDTYLGVILPHTAGSLCFATLVLSAYMASLPVDLEEAAILDGCGRLKIYWSIVVPLSKPAIATVGIFSFVWSYNDLFSVLIFTRDKVRPITMLLSYVSSQYGTNYGLMATAVVLTVAPVFVLYMILQKQIIKGLTSGAVKG